MVGIDGGRLIGVIIDSFEASDTRLVIRLFDALDAWSLYAISRLHSHLVVSFEVCISMQHLFFWKVLYGMCDSVSFSFHFCIRGFRMIHTCNFKV